MATGTTLQHLQTKIALLTPKAPPEQPELAALDRIWVLGNCCALMSWAVPSGSFLEGLGRWLRSKPSHRACHRVVGFQGLWAPLGNPPGLQGRKPGPGRDDSSTDYPLRCGLESLCRCVCRVRCRGWPQLSCAVVALGSLEGACPSHLSAAPIAD